MSEPITEEWLKEVGFKWHQLARQPEKQWLLWLGDAVRDGLGIEQDLLDVVVDRHRATAAPLPFPLPLPIPAPVCAYAPFAAATSVRKSSRPYFTMSARKSRP